MNLIQRGLFVVGGIAVGSFLVNYFVFGNTGDALIKSERIGEWRKAAVREACYPAMEHTERDTLAPKMPAGQHRVSPADQRRAVEMTVALHCYLVSKPAAICQPDNRAYIVDYIGRYYAKKNEMLATAKPYGEAEIRNVETLWNSQRNRAIDKALADNVRNGHLTRSDFGFSSPEPLRPLLAEHSQPSDNCPPASREARAS